MISAKKNIIVGKFSCKLGILANTLGINFKKSNDIICHGVTKHSPSEGMLGILSKLIVLLMKLRSFNTSVVNK
jgi:hypothetical protein